MALTYNVMPLPKFFFVDINGAPYAGGSLTFYASGSTTPQDSYSDSIGTPNLNPLTLDSAGRATVYLAPKAYSIVLKDSAGVTIWTIDPVYGYNAFDVLGLAGEALTVGQAVYLSDGSGGKVAGSWYKADSANTYSSTLPQVGMVPSSISNGATGTIRIIGQLGNLSGLTAGTTYYVGTAGALTSTAPSNARKVGVADSTTDIIMVPNPAPGVVPMTLLRASSGTSTAAAATTVDSIAISGLTALDTIVVEMTLASITQQTTSPILYSVTDAVTVVPIFAGTGSIAAGGRRIMTAKVRNSIDASTRYEGYTIGHDSTGVVVGEWSDNNLATAFTGAWTLGLRHGGVTAGGTFHWSWAVYVLKGQ